MGNIISWEARRKEKEREEAMIADTMEDVENLSLSSQKTSSSSPLWNGLVLHHKDIFVSHVIPKLNGTDRYFFSKVNRESRDVLKYAGVNVSNCLLYTSPSPRD